MADGDLGILADSPIRVTQYADEDFTLFAYDVSLDETGRETSRARMDLSTATVVFEVEDPALVVVEGTPDSAFTFSTPTMTLNDSTAAFTAALINRFVEIVNATTGANDGTFLVTGVPSATSLEYTNINGVAEAQGSATYKISKAIIVKNSSDAAQIEIHADQVDEITKGTSILKLVGADYTGTTIGREYWQDAWVYTGGKKKRILKRSRFYIDDGAHEPTVGVPLAVPGVPARQSQQERSFLWTVPSNGSSFTITVPAPGMLDASFIVLWSRVMIASAGFPELSIPSSGQTATSFDIVSDVALVSGDTFYFELRDYQ